MVARLGLAYSSFFGDIEPLWLAVVDGLVVDNGTLAGRFRALLIMSWDAIRSGQVTRKVFPFNK